MGVDLSPAPRVLIRTDAGPEVGHGHLLRMRSLAAALAHRGASVEVIGHGIPDCDDGSPWTVRALGPQVRDEREDATATLAAAGLGSPDVVIVDHYRLGAPWERMIAERLPGATVVAIDDLPGREHDVDVLVDPNLGPDGPVSVRGARTRLLRGPAYAPLGAEYGPPSNRSSGDGGSERLLIALGGGRSGVIEELVASLITEPRLDAVQLDVVVPDERERTQVERLLHGRSGAEVHRRVVSLRPLLERADLVVGAGGTSAWQRLRVGVPTVLVTLADNQVRTGRALQDLGLARWVKRTDGPDAVTAAVVDGLDDEDLVRRTQDHGPMLVDGFGADRIALALLPPAGPLSVRHVEDGDAPALLAMANDPATRAGSREVREVRPDEHLAWFRATRERCDGAFFVGEVDGLVVGQVRFTPLASGWELHYGLDPIARGRGWSSALVREGLRRLPPGRAGNVVAVVSEGNEPSHRALSVIGFRPASADETAASGARVPDGFSAYLLSPGVQSSSQGA